MALSRTVFSVAATMCLLPGASHAQNVSLLLPPIIDPLYNRDRNISVTERSHPDYDPLGVRVGSFIVHPSVALQSIFTSNVYLDDGNKKSDIYANLSPIVSVDSNWSNHYLGLVAAGDLRRYANQTLRDQNAWYIYTNGRIDVTREANITMNVQLDKSYETPYVEDVASNLTSPSTYFRKFGSLQSTYQPGRVRIRAAIDISNFQFNTLEFNDGTSRSQAFRDRTVYRASGVYEFAISPSLSIYGQGLYDRTRYAVSYIGVQPNRSSDSVNFVGGTNFDLAGLARGTIGIGYSSRSYDAAFFYKRAQGISAQAKIEIFPSEYTTFGVNLSHQLLDSSLGNSGAYWNNALSFNLDRQVLENLIVSANLQAIRRIYLESNGSTDVYQMKISGVYQASRALSLNVDLGYGLDSTHGVGVGDPFHELRGALGVRIRG